MTRQEYLAELLNYYDIERTLSRKGTDVLLLLRHKSLNRSIVVRSTARDLPIADFLKTIRFPSLLEVYDTVHLSDGLVILEEAMAGETLAARITKEAFRFREAKEILIQVADALRVIHEAGYVHRDVKPAYIMLLQDGVVKLFDFDASRHAVGTDDTVRLGTAGFAAPEQYVGASDRRADVFALGVLLNVMLTGKHPSEALPKEMRARHIVEKATAINPEKRFASAEEFKKAL